MHSLANKLVVTYRHTAELSLHLFHHNEPKGYLHFDTKSDKS